MRKAFENQPAVRLAENRLHRPHVVFGRVVISDIVLYRGNGMVDPLSPILFAKIVPHGTGSAIVGEFRRHKAQIAFAFFGRTLLFVLLLGIPVFVALGVFRDPSCDFSPALAVFMSVPVVVLIGIELLIRRRSEISPEDMHVVASLIEGSLLDPRIEEAEPPAAPPAASP